MGDAYASIYEVVRRIPVGNVATYGQVAVLAGRPKHARQVGYALNALPEENDVPWHRVVNAKGEISQRSFGDCETVQQQLLEEEGVTFVDGRIDLAQFRWSPQKPHDAV